jgi:uncharacterized protein YidB (DUF937 family)
MATLMTVALQLLQSNGGIEGILGRLQQQGHGREADSWVGTGDNLPISGNALGRALGPDQIDQAAARMGVSSEDAAGGLASMLPEIINQVTPHGRVESNSNDELVRALESLMGRSR